MKGKIINDPIYGFLRFQSPRLMQIIEHPVFQRLRRIKQMGMAHFVFPGATHTRFHHSLGACHLMGSALHVLRSKQVELEEHTFIAAQQAILMHDIGHGPFSHALEHSIVKGVSHEKISQLLMNRLNQELDGNLEEAIQIFSNRHPITFLSQLVSGQLDMDRMDYLNRDSFYSGVSEGVIGYDRILRMLHVVDGQLVVEEKGIHSIEKFLIARRIMYWQVYLHKTVLSAEALLINILRRAKKLASDGVELFTTPAYRFFLYESIGLEDFNNDSKALSLFCELDDADIAVSIKAWQYHPDKILSTLCAMFIDRRLYKVKLSSDSLTDPEARLYELSRRQTQYTEEELSYYIISGHIEADTYGSGGNINILYKNNTLKEIVGIDNTLITKDIAQPVRKSYIAVKPDLAQYLEQ